MNDTMTSKRNSRVFQDEGVHRGETIPQSKHHATAIATSYRSRRNSRSSGKEDSATHNPEAEQEKLNSVSSIESLAVMAPNSTKDASGALSATVHAKVEAPKRASSVSSESVSVKVTGERPHNFGVVVPGVYRSSYPKPEHFQFLKELKFKTIVTLVKKEELDHELQSFVRSNDIHQVIFNMKGTKKEAISPATMKSILQVVIDPRNYPLMIHCNHGKHRTGCVVAAVRKINGWSVNDSIDEYTSYAQPKVRDTDIDYIRDFQPSEMQSLNTSRFTPLQVRTFARTVVFSTMVMLLWFVSSTQMMASRNHIVPA